MGERCVHVTNRRWHWGGRPPNPPDTPRMTHHPDVPRDRSHRRGLASREGVRYIAFSLHGAGTSRWSCGRLEDSPSGLWRTLGKRVGCKPSGVRIPHPPPQFPLRSRGSRACELTEAHSDVACLRSLWSAPRRRSASRPVNQLLRTRLRQEGARPHAQHIGNRPDRTGERARTAPMASRSRPALDSFRSTTTPGAPRRHPAPRLRPVPADPTAPPGSGPFEACEHRIGERMVRVARSVMPYFRRNPGIKRKSESTHRHRESPMCDFGFHTPPTGGTVGKTVQAHSGTRVPGIVRTR